MSEIDGGAPAPSEAPIDAPSGDDDGGDDEQVVLTRAQIDALYQSARNSAFAEARRAGEFKKQKQIEADPRIRRGLELLAKYEAAHQAEAERLVEIQARADASPFRQRVQEAIGKTKQPSQPAQPAQAQPSRLEQMFEMFLTTQLADKLPKAPITYANPMDALHAEINAQVAAIKDDASLSESQRADRIRQAVSARLKSVKIRPGGSSPTWAQPQPPKK